MPSSPLVGLEPLVAQFLLSLLQIESGKDHEDVNSTTRHSYYGVSDNLKLQDGPVSLLNSVLCNQQSYFR